MSIPLELFGTDEEGMTLTHITGYDVESLARTYNATELARQRAELEEQGEPPLADVDHAYEAWKRGRETAMPSTMRVLFDPHAQERAQQAQQQRDHEELPFITDPRYDDDGIVNKALNRVFDGRGVTTYPSYEEQRAAQQAAGVAMRFNAGKLRYDLLPADAIEELVEIFTMGAAKYAPRNWEKGFNWMECYASLMRHLQAWTRGEDRDPESGRLHIGHVMWNATALTAFQLRGVGTDDRVKLVHHSDLATVA